MNLDLIYRCIIVLSVLCRLDSVFCAFESINIVDPNSNTNPDPNNYVVSSQIPDISSTSPIPNISTIPQISVVDNTEPITLSSNDYKIDSMSHSLYPDNFSSFPSTFVPSSTNNNSELLHSSIQDRFSKILTSKTSDKAPASLVYLDINDKRSSKAITYEFDNDSNTHIFHANQGYLIAKAYDEDDTVWEPEKEGKYADKLTAQDLPNDEISIKVFVPVEEASDSDSESETDTPSAPNIPSYPSSTGFATGATFPSGPRFVKVDTDVLRDTRDIIYRYDPSIPAHTFTPRPDCNITLVVKTDHQMWSYKRGDYPQQIIVIPGAGLNGDDKMQILFPPKDEDLPSPHTDGHIETDYMTHSHSQSMNQPTRISYKESPMLPLNDQVQYRHRDDQYNRFRDLDQYNRQRDDPYYKHRDYDKYRHDSDIYRSQGRSEHDHQRYSDQLDFTKHDSYRDQFRDQRDKYKDIRDLDNFNRQRDPYRDSRNDYSRDSRYDSRDYINVYRDNRNEFRDSRDFERESRNDYRDIRHSEHYNDYRNELKDSRVYRDNRVDSRDKSFDKRDFRGDFRDSRSDYHHKSDVYRDRRDDYRDRRDDYRDSRIDDYRARQSELHRSRYKESERQVSRRDDSQMKLANVELKYYSSTHEISYRYDKNHGVQRFICRQGYLIGKIFKNKNLVKEFKFPKYPDRVLIISIPDDKPILRILYPGQPEGLTKLLGIPDRPPFPAYALKPIEPEVKHREHEVKRVEPEEEQIRLISIDIKETRSTDRIDYFVDRYGSHVFICKKGNLLRKVRSGMKILYEHEEGDDYPNRVVVSISRDGKKDIDILFPEEEPPEPQYLTLDIRYKKSTDHIQYGRDSKGRDVFVAIEPNLFYEVRLGNEVLWYAKDRFPNKMVIIPNHNRKPTLRAFYPREQETIPSDRPMPKTEGYRPEIYKPTAAPMIPPETIVKPKKPEIPVESDIPEKREFVLRPEKVEETKPEIIVSEDADIVQLDVSKMSISNQYSYSHLGNIGTYAPVGNCFFKSVVKGSEHVWFASNSKEYANKVVIDGANRFSHTNHIIIYQINNNILSFTKDKSNWIKMQTEIELDINQKDTSIQIEYIGDSHTHHFIACHNFVFKMVKSKDILIWESDKNFAKKVSYTEHGHDKLLTVFLDDGIITYRKDKSMKSWIDTSITDKSLIESMSKKVISTKKSKKDSSKAIDADFAQNFSESKVKIYTRDPHDLTQNKENDENQYNKKVEDDEVIFEFRRDAQCVQVKYEDLKVWDYDNSKHGSLYPAKIRFNKDDLSLVVDFVIISLLFKYTGNSFPLVNTKKPNPIELDLDPSDQASQTGSGRESHANSSDKNPIERRVINKTVVFEPTGYNSINPIKVGNYVLFTTDDPFSYISFVKAQPPTKPDKVQIHLLNGIKKQYAKSTEGSWTEMSIDIQLFT